MHIHHPKTQPALPTLFIALLLGACGGGGGGGGNAGGAQGDGAQVLTSVHAEAAGAHCADGGARVEAGRDTDHDGALNAGEVTSVQYVCNGSPGPAGANGTNGSGLPSWESISADQQAQPNMGYYVTGDTRVVVQLPTEQSSGNLKFGDLVHIVGVGAGGWKLVQAAGQVVRTSSLVSQSPRPSNRQWTSVASSNDGNNLVAAAIDGGMYTSTDSGKSWSAESAAGLPQGNWVAVTASPNGDVLAAAQASPDNKIYIRRKTQDNVQWQATMPELFTGTWPTPSEATEPEPFSGTWHSLALTANGPLGSTLYGEFTSILSGQWLVASAAEGRDKGLYWSYDYGQSWWMLLNPLPNRDNRQAAISVGPVAIAPNGSTMVAVTYAGVEEGFTESQLITLASLLPIDERDVPNIWSNVGVPWDAGPRRQGLVRTRLAGDWQSVAYSADSLRVVAVGVGQIATSSNGGITWTTVPTPGKNWTAVAYAGDTLVAAAAQDYIYSSIDGGQNWTLIGRKGNWKSLASSADGRKVLAVEAGGMEATEIYLVQSTTPGVDGSISGNALTEVDVRYLGNGQFEVVSSKGELTVQ